MKFVMSVIFGDFDKCVMFDMVMEVVMEDVV